MGLIVFLSLINVSYAALNDLDCLSGFDVPLNTNKMINCHSTCKKVTNTACPGSSIFVPTKTSSEWVSYFLGNYPGCIGISDCFASFTLDTDKAHGQPTSIAIGSDGYPVITYMGQNDANLRFYKCSAADCSTGSVINLDNNVLDASIVIGSDGYPAISYHYSGGSDLKFYKCNAADCSSGTARTLDSDGITGQFTSIAIMNGKPIISYYDLGESRYNYYFCANADCSSGTVRTLDLVGGVTTRTSVAIGNDGYAIFSYQDWNGGNSNLKFARCNDLSCSSVTTRTLDSTGSVGKYSSITKGSDNYPVIAYSDQTNNNLKLYKCSSVDCSSGTSYTLDTYYAGNHDVSIAIGSDGYPIIAYRNSADYDLKIYKCNDVACSSGSSKTLESTGDIGYFPSIAIGDDNNPVISHIDWSNENLRFFKCGSSGC